MRSWLAKCGREKVAGQVSVPLFLLYKDGETMTATKISRIISGSPVRPITVGEPALIHEGGGLRKTTPILNVRRVSPSEIRFETRNTQYVLKIFPTNRITKEKIQ